jgi:hypothetical protein
MIGFCLLTFHNYQLIVIVITIKHDQKNKNILTNVFNFNHSRVAIYILIAH